MERTLRLPSAFRERLAAQLGDKDCAHVLAALGEPRVRCLRANSSLTTAGDLRDELQGAGFELEPAPEPFTDAFVLTGGRTRDLLASEAHRAGRCVVQSLSSMAAVLALDPQPGETVLDLCAAPGEMSGQIAAKLNGRGRLVANERSRKRAVRLRASLLAQHALDATELRAERCGNLARTEGPIFDRVLLSAPSSSEARFHLDQATSWADWKPSKLTRLASDQRKLLFAAAALLRPGGVLVYTTDTFAPEENEVVLHKLLRRFDDELDLVPLGIDVPGERPGLTRWRDRNLDPRLSHARRILPGGAMDGGFLARIVKRA